MRSLTSHTYDAFNADAVAAIVPAFIEDADFLYAAMQRRAS
jgi:hypothetical protein